jgi:uncharacterized membrane protein
MKIICLTTFIIFVFAGCYYDKAELIYPSTGTCDTTNVKYSTTVLSILSTNCYSCHSGTASAGAGIQLDTYTNLKIYITNSQFLNSINQTGSLPAMPLNAAKLSNCDIQKITVWINNGTLYN